GYPTAADLAGFLTASDLAAYAKTADLDGFLVAADLDGYATLDDIADLAASADLDGVVRLITEPLTIRVPEDQPTLRAALRWLDGYAIASDASVVIQLADGHHDLGGQLEITHRDGARVSILGNPADPAAVVLDATGTSGLLVRNNRALGWMEGVTIKGDGTAGTFGVEARDGGVFRAGRSDGANTAPSIVVTGFGETGLGAYRGGLIVADFARLASNGLYGAELFEGGQIRARNAEATGNDVGFGAYNGGFMRVQGASAHDNTSGGFDVGGGAVMDARGATAEDNGTETDGYRFGFAAGNGAVLRADGATARNNGGAGISGWNGATLNANGAVVEDSEQGGITAQIGSSVVAEGAQVSGSGWDGFAIGYGSGGWLQNATSQGNAGSGFSAFGSSGLDAFGSVATLNQASGYAADGDSFVNAPGTLSTYNSESGYAANLSGTIEADFATADHNGAHGFVGRQLSVLQAVHSVVTFNGGGGQYGDDAIHCAGAWCFFDWATIADNVGRAAATVFWDGYLSFVSADVSVADPVNQVPYDQIPTENSGGKVVIGTDPNPEPTPWWD
ncbi:MAG: right-handed parallel beta-helix repeat-containing protein, partial [Myxococcales bacterium]|nr:right-handed parallel beta-helix repeat-containing protein [Myxococcales bacterium]